MQKNFRNVIPTLRRYLKSWRVDVYEVVVRLLLAAPLSDCFTIQTWSVKTGGFA